MTRAHGQGLVAGIDAAAVALARTQDGAASTAALQRNQPVGAAGTDAGECDHDAAHDFDFFFGRWSVDNERLVRRLAGSTDWQRFGAIQQCRPILGGLGNIDEFVTDEFGATLFIGMSLRLFDRATRQWRIWWASNRKGGLEPPVVGRFVDGVGCFEGDDVHEGVPVRVRFIWSGIGPDQACWEQAFSADGGTTWETNWRMRMTRLADNSPGSGDAA